MGLKFTKENFESEVLKSEKPVLVDFYADWCGPCKMLSPIIEEIAKERTDIKVGKVNVDNDMELAQKYKVISIPFVALFKNGNIFSKNIGYLEKDDLLDALQL